MSPTRSIPDRDDVLRALKRLGPSTVADLMRAEGGDRGARRHYRQLIRVLMRDGVLVLDRKGRLSIAKARLADDGGRAGGQGRREGKRAGRAGGGASLASAGESGWGGDGEEQASHRRLKAVPGRMSERPIARFDGHRDGFGFVNPTDGSRDVFIPPHRTGGALHGDLVEYSVLETRPDGRRDGSVLRVVRPTGERIVGLVTKVFPRVEVTPFDSRAGFKFFLEGHPPPGLEEGAAVEIEIPRGTGASARPARLLEVIGPITTPGVDIEVLIRKHHLRVEFPEAVLRETEAHGDEVPQQELSRRRDFSRDVVFTIDGDTAKDFDDAVSVAQNPRGGYDLSVHIADVAHYVRPGSATDIEARQRGTSVYFPGRAIPMLPPALSENLCSLRPQVARLVQSVLMTFDARGS